MLALALCGKRSPCLGRLRDGVFLSGVFRQISLIKWIKVTESTGAEMKGIRALHFLKLPSMAIFPCVFEHFISEMANEKRQNKKAPIP